MGTGPGADGGFDIGLIEVLEDDDHYFVARSGSDEGAAVLGEVGGTPADDGRVAKAAAMVEAAAGEMGRTLDTEGLKEILAGSLDDPIWKELAGKCLTCANCTMVCPTCFCAAVENRTNLDATEAERVRRWDSCFNFEFSYIHGGPLSAVDDPQAQLVGGPVRDARLCRMRAMHHLVPGRHRHHRQCGCDSSPDGGEGTCLKTSTSLQSSAGTPS
jgi:hypothetical protein